jgi:predicted RNase H-like nuclease
MHIDLILAALNEYKTRATYGAVGELLGIPAIGVGRKLGDQRPEASWIVGAKNGKPSGYTDDNCHPELYSNPLVIRTGEQLLALVDDETGWFAMSAPAIQRAARPAGEPAKQTSTKLAVPEITISSVEPAAGESHLMGIDLAWLSDANGSGLAIGTLAGNQLRLEKLYANVIGFDRVVNIISSLPNLSGLAIDAPLIINNSSSSRPCEKALSKVYSPKWAGCHPSNLERYPNAASVRLGNLLKGNGFAHLGVPFKGKWQIECYPHPAIIELFGLKKRLAYKKGKTEEKKAGQIQLARFIKSLSKSTELSLELDAECELFFDEEHIRCLSGQALKDNEDGLDAALCLYIAGLYAIGSPMQCFGDVNNGYIVVPQQYVSDD